MASKGKSPAFQFYPTDWIASTRGLTDEQRGIYIDLLAFMWLDPKCSLPNDDDEIEMLVGAGWRRNSEVLRKRFKTSQKTITNSRLRKEKTKQKERKNNSSKGGQTRAKRYQLKELNEVEVTSHSLDVHHVVKGNPSSSISSSTSYKEHSAKRAAKKRVIYSERFERFWKFCRDIGMPMRDKAKAFKEFKKLDEGEIGKLAPALRREAACREAHARAVSFFPEWKSVHGWLNGRRWEDEPEMPKVNPPQNNNAGRGYDYDLTQEGKRKARRDVSTPGGPEKADFGSAVPK